MVNRSLIVVVGPTASGKSALAMEIAQKHNGEIIAADSRTIYRGMDIGTAKPTDEDQAKIKHHLLDIRNPDEPFSVAEFKLFALTAIDSITCRNKLPILVGGTGLYLDAVIFDYAFGTAVNQRRRDDLNAMSIDKLQNMCRQQHISMPINSKNKRHLVRAIELGGLLDHKKELRSNTLVVGITTNKEKLKDRIEDRAKQMIAQGVIREVALIGSMYKWQGEALKGNIYRIFRGVTEGEKSIQEAVKEIVAADLKLAKRQLTWLKRNPYIVWSEDSARLLEEVDTFLRQQKTSVAIF